MKSILPLTLKREYFDLIANGGKTTEYRERKPYWTKRLEGKTFDIIRFRNGYHAGAPEMEVEFRGMKKVQKWGGPWYAISLGKVLRVKRGKPVTSKSKAGTLPTKRPKAK